MNNKWSDKLTKLINTAVEKNEVLELLRGGKEYEVQGTRFVSDVFPTDIESVIKWCFYAQVGKIDKIDKIFVENICILLEGDAVDVYIALLYYDICTYYEESGCTPFLIGKEVIAGKIREVLNDKKNELQGEIIFCNKMKKINPWKNIENFNKYYIEHYGFGIIEK